MPEEDPLFWDPASYDPAEIELEQANYEAWLESLKPPDWFYSLVGEVASQTVLLESWMTRAALALTGTKGNPLQLIKYTKRMEAEIAKAAEMGHESFSRLLDPFRRARIERNRIVHSLLQWQESDGEGPDYWSQTHPRSNTETRLPDSKPPQWMTDALQNIKDTTHSAFELTSALLAR